MSDTVGVNTVTQMVGDKEIRLLKLTPYDRAEILRKLKVARRTSLLADLKAVEADKGEMLAELRAFDDELLGEPDFINYVNSADGRVDVLDMAMDDIPEAERPAIRKQMAMSGTETLALVAKLCNLVVNDAPAEGSDPNPGSPATPTEPDSYQATNP